MMVDEQKLTGLLRTLWYNDVAAAAATHLARCWRHVKQFHMLSAGGDEVLDIMLEAALRQLENDEALAQFILSNMCQDGFTMGLGRVGPMTALLACIDVGAFRWEMGHGGVEHSLNRFYKVPLGFKGDLRDIGGAIMAWTEAVSEPYDLEK